MIRVIAQVAKLPVSAFVAGCGFFTETMRAWQQAFECGLDAITGSLTQLGAAVAESPGPPSQAVPGGDPINQDLGGDDLKLVKYRILQTRRDHESVIATGEAIVNYATTAADYGGRIACEWMERHPELLKYPGDEKYIRTFVRVIARYPKQPKEYDKDQVEVLREIRDEIRETATKV
jgi:hypothetical protein